MERAAEVQNRLDNIYMPLQCGIARVSLETEDVKCFTLIPEKKILFNPGEFFMVSVWGAGEIPLSTASLSDESGEIQFCLRNVGRVSSQLFNLKEGDHIWIRGPYGRSFPLEDFHRQDVLVVAGGIGIAPLRPLLQMRMKRPGEGSMMLIYGSKEAEQIIFRSETDMWSTSGIETVLTVDADNGKWDGKRGFVTEYLNGFRGKPDRSMAYICGPDIMMSITLKNLVQRGIPEKMIFCTCEKHMKCGVGKCGHCYTGSRYLCIDGPVFTGEEIIREKIL
jgi:sulfhydrogenase subunit gamma (sulfur reductase)